MALSTILLLCFISEASLQYILVETERWPMSASFIRCREEGGSLISIEQLHQYADSIKNQCQTPDIIYWIGNYSTITPFLSLKGCFAYKKLKTTLFEIDNNSIAKCEARCKADYGIAVMNNICQCVKYYSDEKEALEPVDVSRCNIHRNEEILGGKESAMSVYLRSEDTFPTDGINPFCFYGKCDGRRYLTFTPCNNGNEAKIVCMNKGINSARNETTSVWWKAMEECMKNYGSYPLTAEQLRNNVSSLCVENDDTLTWTNQREYRDSIIIPATGIPENFIFSRTMICTMANLTDLNKKESSDCNLAMKESHGYICFVSADTMRNVSRQDSTCIVDIELQTKEISTTRSDPITSERVIMPDTNISQGLIIGIVMAIVVLVIIGIGVTVGLRMSKLGKCGKDCTKNIELNNTSQEPNRSPETYEQLATNANRQNLDIYQQLTCKDIDKEKNYEDLQNYENLDADHVYEKCKGGSTEGS